MTSGGAAFVDYSLDDGQTWTNIYDVAYGSDQYVTCTTAANGGGAGTAWTNPGNLDSTTNYATLTGVAHAQTSQADQATGFGASIPVGSTITGFVVNFDETDGGSADSPRC
ncbi:MAG: hypothetical protein ACLP56_06020 [Candidatus Sulfotelmatobacter sp.]